MVDIDEFTGMKVRHISEAPRDGTPILGRNGSTYIKAQWGGSCWIYAGGGTREVCKPQPRQWLVENEHD